MECLFFRRNDSLVISARSVRGRVVGAVAAIFFAGVAIPARADAQAADAPRAADAQTVAIARGWSALAKGELAPAAAAAQEAVSASPRSVAALALLVEVDIARAGALAALDDYERWMGAKRVDPPYVLRRIALAYLQSGAREPKLGPARTDALRALVNEGDPEAIASVTEQGAKAGPAELEMMAAKGDQRSVHELIELLRVQPSRMTTINALVNSGSQLAVQPLMGILSSPRDEERAAAAEGLAKLGAQQALERIKPLLQDASFTVRVAAAAALYRLGDNSGAPLLEEMLTSEHAGLRLSAAQGLSVRPGGSWLDVARVLTGDPDEAVRLGAARLVAPYDRELAERTLTQLQQSGNLAIREEAGRAIVERVANDFGTLRRMLRSADPGTAVRAAGRILELTR